MKFRTSPIIVLLCIMFFGSVNLLAQQHPKEIVKNWKQQHQDVKLISLESYNQYSASIQAEINQLSKVIIYKDYLQVEDINSYEQGNIRPEVQEGMVNKNFIKDWVDAHPEVELIGTQDLAKMSADKRAQKLATEKKIIFVDQLTQKDIDAYDARH